MANGNRATLKIHWKKIRRNYGGRIDLIPYEWFAHDVADEDKCYYNTGPRGGNRIKAKCKISVSGNQADLYYGGNNEQYNRNQKIIIGTTRVTFYDESRNGVYKVEWR